MKKILFTLSALILVLFIQAQPEVTIYEIQGQQAVSPYDGQLVKTSGIVTAAFSTGFFIQDGYGEWNGLYIYAPNAVALGDEVTITGELTEYYEMTEMKNLTDFQILSTGNDLPEPVIGETWDLGEEALESVLVKVEEAICTNPDLGFGEWELDDGSGPCVVDDMGIAYSPNLGISYSVMGPMFYSFGFYKIEPRHESDIVILENIYFTLDPDQNNLGKTSFTLSWQTNVEATTEVFYGLTPNLELGHLSVPGQTIDHEIEFTELAEGTVYYVQSFSVLDADTTQPYIMPYATVSNSSGQIKILFNHDVEPDVALENVAAWTPSIADSVIAFLNMAQQTLDITMYEQESESIVAAINAAYERGVQVRYITDDQGSNDALENLNPNIPVLAGNSEAIMHDKFIILDGADEAACWVMTGSLNHTVNNLGWDFNNVICLQDKSLATAFTMEFNEMWGSDGPMFDAANAKFGADKTNNTPHKFLLAEVPVEVYFSPSDGTTAQIANVINNTQNELEFGMMVFTENSLGNAIVAAKQRGVATTGIIDYVEYSGSEYQYLLDNAVHVRNYVNPDGTSWPDGPVLHHKYLITDFADGSTNPVLVTGSHNWSASAESKNDENTVIVYDLNSANLFHQEFTKRFNDQITPIAVDDDTLTTVGAFVQINFLANDFIPEGVSFTREMIEGPMHGEAVFEGPYINYQPETEFIGFDTIYYQLGNSQFPDLTDTAMIVIKVGNVGITESFESGVDFTVRYQHYSNQIRIQATSSDPGKLRIAIYDQLGRVIYNENHQAHSGENTYILPLRNQGGGIYFVELRSDYSRKTRKVLIQD